MLARIICAVATASVCVLAQAETHTWTFSYTGFFDQEAAVFLPGQTLSGRFSGEDLNRDGVISRAELSSLTIGALDYIGCAAHSNAYYHCGADRFSYVPGGALGFSVGESGIDPEGWVGGGHFITAGELDFSYAFHPNYHTEHHLRWTADTAVSILSAVPEPATHAMLGAGLLVLVAWRARRRR